MGTESRNWRQSVASSVLAIDSQPHSSVKDVVHRCFPECKRAWSISRSHFLPFTAYLRLCTFFVCVRYDLVPYCWWKSRVLKTSMMWWFFPCIACIANNLPPVGHSSRYPALKLVFRPSIGSVVEELASLMAPCALYYCGEYSVSKRCWRVRFAERYRKHGTVVY